MWRELVERLEAMIPPEGEATMSKTDQICLNVARSYLTMEVLRMFNVSNGSEHSDKAYTHDDIDNAGR